MISTLGHRTFRGVLWSFAMRFSSQAIGFVVIMVMARLLTPADYGLVGMLTIFIEAGSSLTDSGFSQALIRRRTLSRTDTSTAFYFNVVVGLSLYLLIWILAPHIAAYYDEPALESLSRSIGLLIPLNALMVVPKALFCARLDFRTQTRAALIAYTLAGAAGIYLARIGWGVRAIVAYQLLSQALLCGGLWIWGRWWPALIFSRKAFSEMLGFGSRLAVAGLMDIVYRNAYLLVIGKVYRASDLGCFTRAMQIGGFLSKNISGVVQNVSYPSLCSLQDDRENLLSAFRKMASVSCFCVFPLMWALVALPDVVVEILLGPRWSYAALLLPPICLSFMWHPLQSLNLQLLQSRGRSDLFLRVEIWKKAAGVLFLALAVPLGVQAMCWSLVVSAAFSLFCNTWYNGRLHNIGLWRQLRWVAPSFIVSALAALAARLAADAVSPVWLKLLLGLMAGAILYFIWAAVMKRPELALLLRHTGNIIRGQKNTTGADN